MKPYSAPYSAMYLIMDYGTKEKPVDPPVLRTANISGVWKEVDKARQESLLIAVYALDECLLDWS